MMKHNEFDIKSKYKLYRTVDGILHPTISKKNISSYKIIIDDSLIPLRVFYPKKVTDLNEVIIFVHGDSNITKSEGAYSHVSSIFQKKLDKLIISLDYEDYDNLLLDDLYDKIYKTIKTIYKSLKDNGIDFNNITLMGDSTGASALLYINSLNDKDIKVNKEVLFYPILSGEYNGNSNYKSIVDNTMFDLNLINNLKNYYNNKVKDEDINSSKYFALKSDKKINYPNILIMCGNVDPLIDEARDFVSINKNIELYEVCFGEHGFLNSKDEEIIDEYLDKISEYLVKNNE